MKGEARPYHGGLILHLLTASPLQILGGEFEEAELKSQPYPSGSGPLRIYSISSFVSSAPVGHLLHFSHTNSEIPERERKKKSLLKITSKKKKTLGINPTKEVKLLYAKNYKTLIKEIAKMIQQNGKIFLALGLEELTLLKWLYYRKHSTDLCNPYQIAHDIFLKTNTNNPKIYMKP